MRVWRNYRFPRPVVPLPSPAFQRSAEFVSRLELAAVFFDLVLFHSHLAIGPAQYRVWPQRKHNQRPVDVGLDAWTYGRSRQRKTHGASENRGIHLPHHIFQLRPVHLGLQRKRSRVRPVSHLHTDGPSAARKRVVVNPRERTWSRDATHARVAKDVPLARVNRSVSDFRLPPAVRRARLAVVARHISR